MIHGAKKDQLGVVKEEVENENVSAKEKLDNSNKLRLSHVTTISTNALVAFIIFEDEIANFGILYFSYFFTKLVINKLNAKSKHFTR